MNAPAMAMATLDACGDDWSQAYALAVLALGNVRAGYEEEWRMRYEVARMLEGAGVAEA